MGVEILKKPTEAERIVKLESDIALEKIASRNAEKFYESDFARIAKFALENCSEYCGGDRSVGMSACEFYDYEHGYCELKHRLGLDGDPL